MPQDPFDDIVKGYDQQFAPPKVKPVKPPKPPSFDDLVKDVDGQMGSASTPKAQRRQAIAGLQDELAQTTRQVKPGETRNVVTGQTYPTVTPKFQSPIDMRLNAPNEAQKAFDRAAAATGQQPAAPKPRNAFQAPRPKPMLERVMAQQAIERQQPQTVETDPQRLEQVRQATAQQLATQKQVRRVQARDEIAKMNPLQRMAVRGMAKAGGATNADIQALAPPQGVEADLMRATNAALRQVGSTVRGAGEVLPGFLPPAVGRLRKPIQQGVVGTAKGIESGLQTVGDTLAPDDVTDDSFRAKLGRGVGSVGASMGGALATGGGSLAAGTLGALANLGQVAEERERSGVPVSGLRQAGSDALAIATGMTEALGAGRLLNRLGMKTPVIQRVARALEEGGQEYAQSYLNDLNAKLVAAYDPNRAIDDPLSRKRLEEALIGTILGSAGEVADVGGQRLMAAQEAAQQRPITQARQAIDARSAANAAAIAPQAQPVTEPLTEPLTAPVQAAPVASGRSQEFRRRGAQLLGEEIEEAAPVMPATPQAAPVVQPAAQPAPEPTVTGALRAEADAAKIEAGELEQAGDFANAVNAYDAAHKNLKLLRRRLGTPKTPEDVSLINQIDREISLAATNRQKAKEQARGMARQANKPTAGLPEAKSVQRSVSQRPPQGVAPISPINAVNKSVQMPAESAPLLRPDAVQNPEGGVPQMPEQSPTAQIQKPNQNFDQIVADVDSQAAFVQPKGTTEALTSTLYSNSDVRQRKQEIGKLIPFNIQGNKADLLAKGLGGLMERAAKGTKRTIDAFAGSGTYTHYLRSKGYANEGDILNEYEPLRHIAHKQIRDNPEIVGKEAERTLNDLRALTANIREGETFAETHNAIRRQVTQYFRDRLSKLTAEGQDLEAKQRGGEPIEMQDSPETAGLYTIMQNQAFNFLPIQAELGGKGFKLPGFGVVGNERGKVGLFVRGKDQTFKASQRVVDAGSRFKGVDVRRGDGWELIGKEAGAGDLVPVDTSYLNKSEAQTTNYNKATQEDAIPQVYIEKVRKYLLPAWDRGAKLVITNNWDDGVANYLRSEGFKVLKAKRQGASVEDVRQGGAAELIAINFDKRSGQLFGRRGTAIPSEPTGRASEPTQQRRSDNANQATSASLDARTQSQDEAIRGRRNDGTIEDVDADFQPDTADLREVRAFGRKPQTEQFTEEPPTAPLARQRERIRPPAPASPRGVGNRPMTVDVAGERTPVAMSADFPRARREMVRAGREVDARLEMGQEKGDFGNVAEAMFKSNTPDVLHGQDSFFHDPDVKGKLGLTRDAEMADVRRELKTQLAKSLNLSADEVSLSHIKPEVWRAWARQKGLGREAVRKLEAGIARAERKQRAVETNAQIVAEESQRAQTDVRAAKAKPADLEKQIKDIQALVGWTIDEAEAKRQIAALRARVAKDVKADRMVTDEGRALRQEWGILKTFSASEMQGAVDNARVKTSVDPANPRAGIIYVNTNAKTVIDAIWEANGGSKFSAAIALDTPALESVADVLRYEASFLEGNDAKQVEALADAFSEMVSAKYDGAGLINVDLADYGYLDLARDHELFHVWQYGQRQPNNPTRTPMQVEWATNLPGYEKVRASLLEKGYSDDPEDLVREFAAYAATNDLERIGIAPNEAETVATEFLYEYFQQIAKQFGAQHLDRIGRVSVPARSTIERVRDEIRTTRTAARTESQSRSRQQATRSPSRTAVAGIRLLDRAGAGGRDGGETRPATRTSQEQGFSVGRLRNEPQGQLVASGLGAFQNLFNRKPKTKPARPVEKDWNVQKWAKKFYTDSILNALSPEDRAKYSQAKTDKERNAVVLQANLAPDFEAKVFQFIDDATDAFEKGDLQAAGEVVARGREFMSGQVSDKARDVNWFDHMQSRLSNANFKGTYERLAGQQGKEISELFRNAQVDTATGKISRAEAVRRLRTELKPYVRRLKAAGKPGLARWVEHHIDAVSDPDQSFRGLAGFLKGFQYNTKLRLNPRSAIVNSLQPLQTLWPFVTTSEYNRLWLSAFKEENRTRINEILDREPMGSVEDVSNLGRKLRKIDLFTPVSRHNNRVGFLAGEMFADRKGLTGDAKLRMAMDWAKKVEFDNSAYDIPPLFSGKIASVVGQFKPFMVKNLERIYSDWKSAPPEALATNTWKGAGTLARRSKMVAAQLAIGGVRSAVPGLKMIGGVVILGALAKAFSSAGMDDDKAEKMAEAVYFGAPGLIEQDLSGSVMIFDEPFGKTSYEKMVNFFGGPTLSLIAKGFEEGKNINEAEDTKKSTKAEKQQAAGLRLAKSITPLTKTAIALRAAYKGERPELSLDKKEPMTIPEAIGYGLQGTPLRQTKYWEKKEAPQIVKESKAVTEFLPNFFPRDEEKKGTRITEEGEVETGMPQRRPGEPDAVYQKRVERVSGWMDEYGQKLLNHPRYQAMSEADQKAAIESLRRRIGAQQNLTRPKLSSLEPNAVLLGLQRSKAGKAKREREGKYLYTPQP